MTRRVSASYRAPCRPFATGCRQCGKPVPDSRAYCSHVCRDDFDRNHFWGTASAYAIAMARPFGPAVEFQRQPWWGNPVCARCGKGCTTLANGMREAEVNHKRPVNGNRQHFGCEHHQTNLEVVCHDCHVAIGVEQRRAGLIGKPRPERVGRPIAPPTPPTVGHQLDLNLAH